MIAHFFAFYNAAIGKPDFSFQRGWREHIAAEDGHPKDWSPLDLLFILTVHLLADQQPRWVHYTGSMGVTGIFRCPLQESQLPLVASI